MGKLFNILAFLLILLFIVGVGWLGYQSYEHMKVESATTETSEEVGADYVSEESDDTDTEWDEDEDLLDDDEVMGSDESGDDELEEDSDLNAEELLATLDDEETEGVGGTELDMSDIIKDEAEKEKKQATEFNKMVNLSPSDLYYVIVGSFTIAENADFEVAAMKKKGYTETETVQFASTKYLSVSAGRFKTQEEARKLAEKIKNDLKIDVYVHKRRFK